LSRRNSTAKYAQAEVLAVYGFDIMTPQQRSLFGALRMTGTEVFACAPERREAGVLRVACVDARDEIGRARPGRARGSKRSRMRDRDYRPRPRQAS